MGIFNKKTEDEKPAVTKTDEPKKSMKALYAEEKTATGVKKSTGASANAHRVIVKPLITEKAAKENSNSKYVFAVNVKTNKIEIAKAIAEIYGVKPVAVNIIKMEGKKVSRGRTNGQRKDWKKAIVTLKKGESIKVYEGV